MTTTIRATTGCRSCNMKMANKPRSPREQAREKERRLRELKPVLDKSKF